MRLSVLSFLTLLSILCYSTLTNCQTINNSIENINNRNKLIPRIPIPQLFPIPAPKDPENPHGNPSNTAKQNVPFTAGPSLTASADSITTVTAYSTTTTHVAPPVTTLGPGTVIIYTNNSYKYILSNLWIIGIFNMISTIALCFI
jgi:hypothetical protein